VSAMRPGFAKIIEKVRISWYFVSPEADLHKGENAGCYNDANTWSPKRVYWLTKCQSSHCSTSDYGCEDTVKLYSGVVQTPLPLTGFHPRVSSEPKILWISATFHNLGWMDDCQVCHGSIEAISILDPVGIDGAYSHIASGFDSVSWHVRSHEWRDASFGQEEDCIAGTLVLRCEVSSTVALRILRRSHYHAEHASDFLAQRWSFHEVASV
jgi:hypothetical protein